MGGHVQEGKQVIKTATSNHTGGWRDSQSLARSGTYNNQWMIVDYNKLKESPQELSDGVFTVAEQIPGDVKVVDEVRK